MIPKMQRVSISIICFNFLAFRQKAFIALDGGRRLSCRKVKIMKKYFLFLLTICLVMGSMTACFGSDEPAETTETTASNNEGTTSILDSISVKDYDGATFTILGVGNEDAAGKDGSIVSHNGNGELTEKVVYERTLFLEEKYNMIMNYKATNGTLQAMEADQMGGGGSYDLVIPHPTEGIARIITEGFCADIMSMEAINLDQPWFRAEQIETYTTNGKLYQVASDFSVGYPIEGFVYNKDLYRDAGLTEDLYDVVFDGDWTLEKFYDTVMSYQPSMEGVSDNEKMYSLVHHQGQENRYLYGCDQKTVKRNGEGTYELALDKDSLNTIASYLYQLIHESENVYVGVNNSEAAWGTSEMMNIFTSGRAIFIHYNIGGLYGYLRELNFEVGYLPMPKYDTYQKDYRSISTNGGVIIPSALAPEKQQMSAAVLDAFARYNNVYMRPAFFDLVLQGRLSQDERDYKILELMMDSAVFDIGYTIDGSGTGYMKGILTQVVVISKATTVDSYLTSRASVLSAIVDQINAIG